MSGLYNLHIWFPLTPLLCQAMLSIGPSTQRNSNPVSILHIDPLAVSAYVGDLYAMQLLSADMVKACITFLVNRIRTPFHIHCVERLLDRANSSQIASRLDSCFLLDCVRAIQRSHLHTKHISLVSYSPLVRITSIIYIYFYFRIFFFD